jgi:UDP-N-acetylmuramoyl-tripeptide--D-alanyl-D-alanine ligase
MFDTIIPKIKAGEMNISTDTRTIKPGDIFFAIKGELFDGHDYIAQAIGKGAAVCVVSKEYAVRAEHTSPAGHAEYIVVDETLLALQQLATLYRKEFSIPVIGISGCNGKTTTKNLMASVLREHFGRDCVLYTLGNHNNFIGVPLTILSLRSRHKAAVIELGSNHPGEISMLCEIAQPTHGITTNIGAAHIEFFKTLEAIADEEGAIARFLPKEGLYAVPKSDQYAEYLLGRTPARKAAVDAKSIECLGTSFLNFQSRLHEIGIRAPHIAMDALLAAALAYDLGVSADKILKGISETKNDPGRFSPERIEISNDTSNTSNGPSSDVVKNGTKTLITVIDDTYNGNPDSVIAAIKAMDSLYPVERKIVALGCLKELGEYLHTGYERIANACNEHDVSELILINIDDTFGDVFEDVSRIASGVGKPTKIVHVKDNAECAEYIKKNALAEDVILCKGSNGAKTWEVIEGLKV